jgi:hypothetical protein
MKGLTVLGKGHLLTTYEHFTHYRELGSSRGTLYIALMYGLVEQICRTASYDLTRRLLNALQEMQPACGPKAQVSLESLRQLVMMASHKQITVESLGFYLQNEDFVLSLKTFIKKLLKLLDMQFSELSREDTAGFLPRFCKIFYVEVCIYWVTSLHCYERTEVFSRQSGQTINIYQAGIPTGVTSGLLYHEECFKADTGRPVNLYQYPFTSLPNLVLMRKVVMCTQAEYIERYSAGVTIRAEQAAMGSSSSSREITWDEAGFSIQSGSGPQLGYLQREDRLPEFQSSMSQQSFIRPHPQPDCQPFQSAPSQSFPPFYSDPQQPRHFNTGPLPSHSMQLAESQPPSPMQAVPLQSHPPSYSDPQQSMHFSTGPFPNYSMPPPDLSALNDFQTGPAQSSFRPSSQAHSFFPQPASMPRACLVIPQPQPPSASQFLLPQQDQRALPRCGCCLTTQDRDLFHSDYSCEKGCLVCISCMYQHGLPHQCCPLCKERGLSYSEMETISVRYESMTSLTQSSLS